MFSQVLCSNEGLRVRGTDSPTCSILTLAFSELVIPMPERLVRDEMGPYEGGAFHRLAPGMAT